jgi:hypothetical protein
MVEQLNEGIVGKMTSNQRDRAVRASDSAPPA